MHAFRRVGIHGDHQILVNLLRHEGYKGRDHLAQRHQHVVQGDEGGFLVVSSMPLPQKRSRQRRTYQLLRSSTKSVMARAASGM